MRNIWWKVTDAGEWWDEIKAQKKCITLDQCYAYPTKCSREKVYFVEIKIFRTFMVVLCGGHPHLTGQKFANSTVKEMLKWTLRVNKELLLDRRQSRKAKTIIYHNIDNRSNQTTNSEQPVLPVPFTCLSSEQAEKLMQEQRERFTPYITELQNSDVSWQRILFKRFLKGTLC